MVWYFNIVCSVMWVGCLRWFVGGLFVCYWGDVCGLLVLVG